MKRLILALLLLAAPVAIITTTPGCASKLEQGGAYAPTNAAPDKAFFIIESSYDLAYSALDGVFKFERDNRTMLWKISPDLKHSLDKLRPQAAAINQQYLAARKVYIANPVPANLPAMQTLLAKLQQISTTALALLPK